MQNHMIKSHGYREKQNNGLSNAIYYNGVGWGGGGGSYPQIMADQEAKRSLMTSSRSVHIVRVGKINSYLVKSQYYMSTITELHRELKDGKKVERPLRAL